MARSVARASEKEALKNPKKSHPKASKPTKGCGKKESSSSTSSSSDEGSSSSEGWSSDDQQEKAPLEQLLAAPKKPKADPPLAVVKEIEELPVLRLFAHHLHSFEGGARKQRIGKNHVQRVGRLLYEVDDAP